MGKFISELRALGYIDSTGNLVPAHDAAGKHLGAPWWMPTSEEIQALVDYCTTTWTTKNGVYGRLVTGKGSYASKSIFLPTADCSDDFRLDYPGLYGYYRYAEFGFFQTRVVPPLQLGQFLPTRLLPLLRAVCSASPRICQIAGVLPAHPFVEITASGVFLLFAFCS